MSYKKLFLIIASILTFKNVNAQATEIPIGEGATATTSTSSDSDSFLFTGNTTGTLDHDDATASRTFGSVTTNNDMVGVINITSSKDLTIESIGSAAKKIDRINFSVDDILTVNGSIYTTNGIIANGNPGADITLSGTGIIVAGGDMGSISDPLDLVVVFDNSNATFYTNIYTNGFDINQDGTATLQGNNTSNIQSISLSAANTTLNINTNISAGDLTTSTSSTVNIAAAKQLSLSDTASINGTLGIGIDNSANGSAPSITSTSAVTIGSNTRYIFDYSKATYLKVGDSYNFLTTSGSGSLTTVLNQTASGNSFLLTPSVTKTTGTDGFLTVTQNLNTANRDSLSSKDQTLANFLIDSNSSTIDKARTALLALSSQSQVQEGLSTLTEDRNNMIQRTAMSVSTAIDNMIDSHLHSINYEKFFSHESFGDDLYEVVSAKPERTEEEEKNFMLFKANGKDYEVNKLAITRYKFGYDSKFYNYNELASFSSKEPKAPKKKIPEESVKNVWGEVFGASTNQNNVKSTDSTSSVKGYKANYGGVIFGLDKIIPRYKANSILGASLAYSTASANSKSASNQKIDITSYHFSLYNYNISKNGLGFVNENIIGVGYNQYNSNRLITIGSSFQSKSAAQYSGIEYNAKMGFGYNFQVADKAILSPIAAIKYFGLQLQDYTENNNDGLAMKVQNDNFNLFTSELGLKFMDNTSSTVQPQISVSWLHNLNTQGSRSSSSFVNGVSNQQSIQNNGINLDPNILNVVTQVAFESSKNSKIILKYDFQKSVNFTSYLGSIKFNLEF